MIGVAVSFLLYMYTLQEGKKNAFILLSTSRVPCSVCLRHLHKHPMNEYSLDKWWRASPSAKTAQALASECPGFDFSFSFTVCMCERNRMTVLRLCLLICKRVVLRSVTEEADGCDSFLTQTHIKCSWHVYPALKSISKWSYNFFIFVSPRPSTGHGGDDGEWEGSGGQGRR